MIFETIGYKKVKKRWRGVQKSVEEWGRVERIGEERN